MDNVQELKVLLKEKGYKLTPQRRAVLNMIMDNPGKHLTTEEIYDLVKVQCPDIGLATVYRTLQILNEMDLILKINLDDGCSRYEYNIHQDDHEHHHLICTDCGRIVEVNEDLLDSIERQIEKDYDFSITDHKVKFFGLCSKCR
ncbi:Fur family transcriptional regulator, ferric uptake regulator [Tindallia magadiensis]|uniref:Fur family transcriptional regulator, ferric uptake regulator n=1 Tax=Tindallia magadiensis TaxID=69895 RepID=A0A1I3ACE1_9FIRM|nr:Fur family transcriptional regulator [Tindallia magadiensis]SFH47476.1 Fur family transcriptional regulator, ferric uptake regulator [Tindallia magadiensis]